MIKYIHFGSKLVSFSDNFLYSRGLETRVESLESKLSQINIDYQSKLEAISKNYNELNNSTAKTFKKVFSKLDIQQEKVSCLLTEKNELQDQVSELAEKLESFRSSQELGKTTIFEALESIGKMCKKDNAQIGQLGTAYFSILGGGLERLEKDFFKILKIQKEQSDDMYNLRTEVLESLGKNRREKA